MYSNIKDIFNLDEEHPFWVKEDDKLNKVEIHTYIPGAYIPTEITVVKGGKSYKAILKKVKYTDSRNMFEITYKKFN